MGNWRKEIDIKTQLKKDLIANRAFWYHRAFWFFLFLRGAQSSQSALIRFLCKALKQLVLIGTCCELPSQALVGSGIYIPHFNGIVISPYARINSNVTLMQQTTIGVDFEKDPFAAPTIGEGVLIGAGAKVIGDCTVGEKAKIGANAVVTRDVPAKKTVVGANRLI